MGVGTGCLDMCSGLDFKTRRSLSSNSGKVKRLPPIDDPGVFGIANGDAHGVSGNLDLPLLACRQAPFKERPSCFGADFYPGIAGGVDLQGVGDRCLLAACRGGGGSCGRGRNTCGGGS